MRVLFLFVLIGNCLLAEDLKNCIRHEAHESLLLALIDRTDKGRNSENLRQTILRVKETAKPGERVVMAAITARANETRILLDLVRPKKDLWESPLKTKAKDHAFVECINSTEKQLESNQEEHKNSAILETLGFVSKVFEADAVSDKVLIMHSDMLQNSEYLSFLQAKTIEVEPAVKKIKKDGMVPNLKGVTLSVAGAGEGLSDLKARQLEQFWRALLGEAGANLKFYGPVMAEG